MHKIFVSLEVIIRGRSKKIFFMTNKAVYVYTKRNNIVQNLLNSNNIKIKIQINLYDTHLLSVFDQQTYDNPSCLAKTKGLQEAQGSSRHYLAPDVSPPSPSKKERNRVSRINYETLCNTIICCKKMFNICYSETFTCSMNGNEKSVNVIKKIII